MVICISTLFHIQSHIVTFSGSCWPTSLGCEPHEASLPRTCLCCSQLSRLIHQRWECNRVSSMRSYSPAACQTLVTALDLILERVARTISQREDMKSGLPGKHAAETGLFCKALFHGKILSPSYRGRPAIHKGRQMRAEHTCSHSFTEKQIQKNCHDFFSARDKNMSFKGRNILSDPGIVTQEF